MLQSYLVRGLKAGLVAGVAFGLFVAVLANPMIAAAEGLAGEHGHDGESAHAAPDHGGHNDAGGHAAEAGPLGVVSAPLVSVVGGVFWALLLGVVTFGLVFYLLEPAIPGTGATKSAVTAAAGFVTVSGAPWLVFPPQPPGVEPALAIDVRMGLYAGLMLAGLSACLLAGYAYNRLRDGGRGRAVAGAAIPFALLVGLAFLLPANTTAGSLPSAFVDAFRAQVLFGQAMLWSLLAGTHTWLSRRASRPAGDVAGAPVRTDAPPAAD